MSDQQILDRLAHLERSRRRTHRIGLGVLALGLLGLAAWGTQKPAQNEVRYEVVAGGQMKYPVLIRWNTRTGTVDSKRISSTSSSWRPSSGYNKQMAAAPTQKAESVTMSASQP